MDAAFPENSDAFLPLHPYQKYCRDFILAHPACAIWLEMGMGKCLITLAALYDMNWPCHVLVVAPKNIARSTWLDEIEDWNIPIRTCSLIVNERGKQMTKKKRLELYAKVPEMEPTVFFVNRELIPQLVEATPKDRWPFPVVILDEAQGFKSHSSTRFQALKKVRPQILKLIELTGTPMPNGLHDLWAQAYLLDQGARLGATVTAFRDRWFTPGLIVNDYPVTYNPRPGAQEEISSLLDDVTVSMRNDMLTLPDLTINDIRIRLEPAERELYDTLMQDKVLTLANDEEVVAANAAVLQSKLSQMASGALYINDEHDFERIHDHKLEWTATIVENSPSPVLVAYYFKSDLVMLEDYFRENKIPFETFDGSPETIRRWNAGEIKTLALQPASAGHGLNLQKGGHTLVWYTLPWSLELYQQTCARLHRQGQTDPVVIHRLIVTNSIDGKIRHALDVKDLSQSALLDAVRTTIHASENTA